MLLYGDSHWVSPYVFSSCVALREKGLPFEVRPLALQRGEHLAAEFAKQSLTVRVPTLVDGDFALSESSAIAEYLEEAYPAPGAPRILPAGLRDRARARQVMAWVRSDLLALREERSSEYVFYPPEAHSAAMPTLAPLSPRAERAARRLLEAADALIPASAGSIFGAWCIADTDLAMMLQRLGRTGYPLPDKIRRYVDGQWQRPSVVAFIGQLRPPYEGRP
jgi:glutathione S-transferase